MRRAVDVASLYRDHVSELQRRWEEALDSVGYDGVVIHAGPRRAYHADDLAIPFRATPHFRRWAPIPGPDHWILLRAGSAPRAIRVVPRDFWVESPESPDHPFAAALDVHEVPDVEAALCALGSVANFAYVGSDAAAACAVGIAENAVEPDALMAPIDWQCARKTAYEVHCVRESAARAGRGHAAARSAAGEGCSEREIHAAYLSATDQLDAETPYPNIVAWDSHSAVLHYSAKRSVAPALGAAMLIDAGAEHWGYASDITRTYAFDAPALFFTLLDGMEALQRRCVDAVATERPYLDVHAAAIHGVAELLCEVGVLRGEPEGLCERGLVRPFMPHGVGHQLGVQVHDVGGIQATPSGGVRRPPETYPSLRNTRSMEVGQIVTVEPGLYFIPMLLDPYRTGSLPGGEAFDWNRIDALMPCGGIRIEDDVLVTADGREDLTRPWVPGHRDS